jgi:HMG (high mobility group) box
MLIHAGQIGKILGERWKNMNEKDKAVYEAKATKDKERYEAEKRAYNVSSPITQLTSGVSESVSLSVAPLNGVGWIFGSPCIFVNVLLFLDGWL